LPQKYMVAIMMGNGLAGISVNLLRMFLQATMPNGSMYLHAQVFFIVSAIVLLACGLCYRVVEKNEFYIYYVDKHRRNQEKAKRKTCRAHISDSEEVSTISISEVEVNPKPKEFNHLATDQRKSESESSSQSFRQFLAEFGRNFR